MPPFTKTPRRSDRQDSDEGEPLLDTSGTSQQPPAPLRVGSPHSRPRRSPRRATTAEGPAASATHSAAHAYSDVSQSPANSDSDPDAYQPVSPSRAGKRKAGSSGGASYAALVPRRPIKKHWRRSSVWCCFCCFGLLLCLIFSIGLWLAVDGTAEVEQDIECGTCLSTFVPLQGLALIGDDAFTDFFIEVCILFKAS